MTDKNKLNETFLIIFNKKIMKKSRLKYIIIPAILMSILGISLLVAAYQEVYSTNKVIDSIPNAKELYFERMNNIENDKN